VPVEALRAGERVATAVGGMAEIVWLGHRRVDCRRHPNPRDVWPVRIEAEAFGRHRPSRDLWLSPDHAVFVAGDLIPIRYLVNGATIAQMPADQVTYWHVELPAHGVIYAEGLAAESYLDTGNRAAFANAPGATMMTPDFARRVWEARSGARLVHEGEALRAARVALLERAEALGHAATDDPALHVVAGGRVISPLRHGDVYRFTIPGGATRARVVSRSAIPAAVRACCDDHRRLGVAVSRLTLDGEVLALSDARLGDGWHEAEPGWRWTDGDAGLTLEGGSLLDIELAMTERYWLPAPSPRLMGSGVR
jgi:hypothetical protein